MAKTSTTGNSLETDFKRAYCDADTGVIQFKESKELLVGGLTQEEYAGLRQAYGSLNVDNLITYIALNGNDDYISGDEQTAFNNSLPSSQNAAKYRINQLADLQFSYVRFAVATLNNSGASRETKLAVATKLSVYLNSPSCMSLLKQDSLICTSVVQNLTKLLVDEDQYVLAAQLLAKFQQAAMAPMMLLLSDKTQSDELRSRALFVAVTLVADLEAQDAACLAVYASAFDASLAKEIGLATHVKPEEWQAQCEKLVASSFKISADVLQNSSLQVLLRTIMPELVLTAIHDLEDGQADSPAYTRAFRHLGLNHVGVPLCLMLGFPETTQGASGNNPIGLAYQSLGLMRDDNMDSVVVYLERAAYGLDESWPEDDAYSVKMRALRAVTGYSDYRKRYYAAQLLVGSTSSQTDTIATALAWGLQNDNKIFPAIEALEKLSRREDFNGRYLSDAQWDIIAAQKSNSRKINGDKDAPTIGQLAQELLKKKE